MKTEVAKILIVDDKPENLLVLESLLSEFHLRLYRAQSGNRALELCLEHDFALILMDVSMPEMDGFETARLIRSRTPVPIIFITAFAKDLKSKLQGYQSGAIDYIIKPIEPEILKSKVRLFLDLDYKTRELLRISEELSSINDSLVREVQERKLAQEKIRKFSLAIEQSPVSIVITDINANIEYVNPQFCKVTGYTHKELIGQKPDILKSGRTSDEEYKRLWSLISNGKTWQGEFLNKKKNGETFWEKALISPVKNSEGKVTHYLGIKQDITLEKKQQEKLIKLAYYDDLTGLPSRALHLARLAHEISRAKRERSKVALLFIDLDGFKNINDTYGHSTGDDLLVEVADRMKKAVRIPDNITRIGGDEFSIIVTDFSSTKQLEKMASRLLHCFSKPFLINGKKLSVTSSIGIALYPDDAVEPEELYSRADIAMYKVKNAGRNHYAYFTKEMNIILKQRFLYETSLSSALANKEFYLAYQPVVDLKSRQIAGFEALLRWENPRMGKVPPGQFITVAEEMGLISTIGEWILETGIAAISELRKEKRKPFYLTINISAHQLHSGKLSKALKRLLKKYNLEPDALKLELTENIILQERPEILKEMLEIGKTGVELCIDDFGTGYSSLAYLSKYNFDYVKIDKIFVENFTKNSKNKSLLHAIIGMAQGLHIKLIAEGIETRQQLDFLIENGCQFGQGYYFYKPMQYERVSELVC